MKKILITGATGAVGKATAYELAKRGCHVILFGRNQQKLNEVKAGIESQTNNKNIDVVIGDLSEPKSIQKATDEIRQKYTSLDAVINIAGVYKSKRLENSNGDEMMFATNQVGPFTLTNKLIDLVKSESPGRIIFVSAPSTSKINFDDINSKNKFSSLTIFGASKMMNLMTTYAFARKFEGTGITSNVIHPGLVKSDITSEMPGALKLMLNLMSGKPDKAAKMLADLALDDKYQHVSGKFFSNKGKEMKSNDYSHDISLQEKVWQLSEQHGR